MEPFVMAAAFVGGVLLILLARWLSRATTEESKPPSLSDDDRKKLELIRLALISKAKINSNIRIETQDKIVLTFKLEKPGVQVNSVFTSFKPKKFF